MEKKENKDKEYILSKPETQKPKLNYCNNPKVLFRDDESYNYTK